MITLATVIYAAGVVMAVFLWGGVINLLIADSRTERGRERDPVVYDCYGGCGASRVFPLPPSGLHLGTGEWVCPACIKNHRYYRQF